MLQLRASGRLTSKEPTASTLTLGAATIRLGPCFFLGDGLTCGTGHDAPKLNRFAMRDKAVWRFGPPALTREFQEHFEAVLQSFAARSTGPHPVLLLPVLADYKFCEPGVWPVRR